MVPPPDITQLVSKVLKGLPARHAHPYCQQQLLIERGGYRYWVQGGRHNVSWWGCIVEIPLFGMSLLRTLRTLLRGYQLDDPCKQNIMKSLIWICRYGNIWSCYSQLLAEKNLLKTNCWMLALFFGPMPVNIIQIPRLPNYNKCCTYQNSTITTLNVFYIDMTHTNSVTSHTKSNQKHIKKTQCNITGHRFHWGSRLSLNTPNRLPFGHWEGCRCYSPIA